MNSSRSHRLMLPLLLLIAVFVPLLLFILPLWFSFLMYRLYAQPPPETRFPDYSFTRFFNPRGPPLPSTGSF
jgi:hypothetical protein